MSRSNKISIATLTSALILSTCLVFTACGPTHPHSYTAQQIAATCQERAHTQYTCECGDSYSDNFTGDLAPHVGQGTCRTCGINYFDALAAYIQQNGQYYGGDYTLNVSALVSGGTTSGMTCFASYSPDSDQIIMSADSIGITSTGDSTILLLELDDALGSYHWILSYDNASYNQSWLMNGNLNATTLTESTQTLSSATINTFPAYINTEAKELAASLVKLCVAGMDVLLVFEGSGITAANFGFDNY